MVKWLRWIIVLIFAAAVTVPALLSPRQMVEIRLLLPPMTLESASIGALIFIFSAYAICATVLLALLDRAQLTKTNRTLRQTNKTLEAELTALRQLVAGEQDDE